MAVVLTKLNISVEMRGSHWAAKSEEFGVTTYADTCGKSVDRLFKAIEILVGRINLRKNPSEYLTNKGIQHNII